MTIKKPDEFWITNISRTHDVSLGDLRITVRRGQSINLFALNKKGKLKYNFSKDHVLASFKNGSIYKKRDVIKVREVKPVFFSNRIDVANVISRKSVRLNRKPTEIEELEFPDLDVFPDDDVNDDVYAVENADAAVADRRPAIAVDPKFFKDDE